MNNKTGYIWNNVTEGRENILVIAAHPDDEIFGPGGTLAKYASEGKNIFAIIFSFGEQSHPWLQKAVTAKTRVRECKAAADIISCKNTLFLGFKEGNFRHDIKKKGFASKFRNIIASINPSKIFVHSSRDLHPDHRAVHKITLSTLTAMKSNAEVYVYEIWTPFVISREMPKLVVDTTHYFDKKLDALKKFRSQYFSYTLLLPAVYLRALFTGYEYGFKYAEAFTRVR